MTPLQDRVLRKELANQQRTLKSAVTRHKSGEVTADAVKALQQNHIEKIMQLVTSIKGPIRADTQGN